MNILQHNIERFGMVTVMDVVLYDIVTGAPKLFLDTLKMTNINTEGSNKEIRGGIGNDMLISYDFGRTANIEMQDALLSTESLALLWGTAVAPATVKDVNIVASAAPGDTPVAGSVYIYPTNGTSSPIAEGADDFSAYTTGEARFIYKTAVGTTSATYGFTSVDADMNVYIPNAVAITSVVGATTGAIAYVFDAETSKIYIDQAELTLNAGETVTVTYDKADGEQITLTNDNFPSAMRMVGSTFVIDENTGVKKHIQIEIPKLKINSNFSFSMDAEGDASVFDFSGVGLSDGGDVIKLKYLGNY